MSLLRLAAGTQGFALLLPAFAVILAFSPAPAQTSARGATVQTVVALTAYPRLAQLAAVQGTVRLVARVRGDGSVESVRRVLGPGILSHDAEQLLMKWRFNKCDSGCGTREVGITFHFVLEGECTLPDCQVDFEVDLPATVTVKAQKARAIIN